MSGFGQPALAALLEQAVAAQQGVGLPFRDYMDLVLYHPREGYYMGVTSPIGRGGDFVTSPEITSLFGELLTLQWIEIWQALGQPGRFTVVELGPGSGRLAADVLTTARRFPPFCAALDYRLVECSPGLQDLQRRTLAAIGALEQVSWPDGQALTGIEGVIFSNEFFDALPVHWVEQGEDGLLELRVHRGEQGWIARPGPPGAGLDPELLARRGIHLAPGHRTEVGLEGLAWMERLARTLERGLLVTVDYGHPAADYYHPVRSAGTLAGHRRQERVDDPLAHPGAMDLTAHVDFSALAAAGTRGGLDTLGFTAQGWFLLGLGILERLEQVQRRQGETGAAGGEALKEAVLRLIMPGAMGERFKVLAQGRGLPEDFRPAGFRLNDQRHRL
ncbi:MAG: SAM-dependent methyltransferase [Magnetococcales bacterium]|nr:SAM-dependent methyltransferase [Magnetococcales bacterium]